MFDHIFPIRAHARGGAKVTRKTSQILYTHKPAKRARVCAVYFDKLLCARLALCADARRHRTDFAHAHAAAKLQLNQT